MKKLLSLTRQMNPKMNEGLGNIILGVALLLMAGLTLLIRGLKRDHNAAMQVIERDRRLKDQYEEIRRGNTARQWNSFFIGCAIAAFIVLCLNYCGK